MSFGRLASITNQHPGRTDRAPRWLTIATPSPTNRLESLGSDQPLVDKSDSVTNSVGDFAQLAEHLARLVAVSRRVFERLPDQLEARSRQVVRVLLELALGGP